MTASSLRTPIALLAVAVLLAAGWFAWRPTELAPRNLPPASPPANASTASVAAEAEPGTSQASSTEVPAPEATRTPVAHEPGVFGRLVQQGTPMHEVEVQARRMYEDIPVGDAVHVGAGGRFAVPLPQGNYRLALRGAGVPRGHSWRDISVSAGQRLDLGDLEVPPGATITGTVVDELDKPIAHAFVFVTGDGLPPIDAKVVDIQATAGAVFAHTDAHGRFQITEVRAGDCFLVVEHRDHWSTQQQAQPIVGATYDCGILVLRSFPALHGLVVDAVGAPVAGARVVPGGAGQHSSLQPRRAVTTDARGLFTLPCFGRSNDLTVFADGCEPLPTIASSEAPAPVRFVVKPANVLQGRVVGADRAGVLRVEAFRGDPWRTAAWVSDMIFRDHPVAADGTFRIAALPAGEWQITAKIPGVGTTAPRVVALPASDPVEIVLQPDLEVAVRVVDDLGAPVAGATIVRAAADKVPEINQYTGPSSWFGWAARDETTTDANGEASVHVPAGKPLLLAARSPHHLVAGITALADAVPASVALTVPRGAMIAGRIDDGGLGTHVRFIVRCTAAAAPDEERHLGSATVGRDGQFVVAPLPPQRVHVSLAAVDDTRGSATPNLPLPLPLLGSLEATTAPIDVELRAGEVSVAHFATPTLGEITGRVLCGGVPQASALVYGVGTTRRSRNATSSAADLHEPHPHTRTDAEGRFRFLVAKADRWRLSARSEDSRHWAPAIDVDCATATTKVHVDIALPGGSIRGIHDVSAIARKDREHLEAQVYPLAEAHHDAFLSGDWRTSQSWRMPKQKPSNDGGFAFTGVPPGAWVVRIVESGWEGSVVWQRVVRVVGDEDHDLGRVERRPRHAVRVRTGAGAEVGLWLAEPTEGNEHGLFVRTIESPEDGAFDLGQLAPGRYLLRPFRRGMMVLGDSGASGEAFGAATALEVHADGGCTPNVLWPDGLK